MAFDRRGLVFTPRDLDGVAWVPLLAQAGLNLVALHGGVEDVIAFAESPAGQRFLTEAAAAGLAIEYELHAMSWLLPRERFAEHRDWFRMDRRGERRPDANLCPSQAEALAVAGTRALELAERLPPSTERYYFWPDDAGGWCHCDTCRGLTASDQQVVVMNAILAALRSVRPEARLACLAYANCLAAPTRVTPAPGLFLEYAPIDRCFRHALGDSGCAINREYAAGLSSLLAVFGEDGAQVLEYWLDASMFSGWRRPARRVPFEPELLAADLALYASLGFRSVTGFGVYLDADYFATYGPPPIGEYGRAVSAASACPAGESASAGERRA